MNELLSPLGLRCHPVVKPIVPEIFLKDPDVIPVKAGIQTKKSLKLKIFYYIVFVK
ncbi:MAG TPA: hypothetical protein LFV92_02335 [Rickettsia endosymbiont of Ceroptres masudai]|nr:hypothetical protein [Rickettsia endosymbiont of Ceroptres masudai]